MVDTHRLVVCAFGAVVLGGCGAGSSPAPPGPRPADPCLLTDAAAARDTLRVPLLTPVDAGHAPVPTSDDERLVFRQLYETLVRVDCAGDARPGLAASWRTEDGGRRWTFELRSGARFWDGTPVDAGAVRDAWDHAVVLAVQVGPPGREGTIVVTLAEPRSVAAFGDPAWSVVKRIPESRWLLGTGPRWVRDWADDGATRVLRAAPTPAAPPGLPVLEFRAAGGGDPRDGLDQPVDALITRDAGVLRYAAGREDWTDVPLPWDRVYVLASPLRIGLQQGARLDSATQAALARDAVRDDARAAASAAWWSGPECPADSADDTGRSPPTGLPTIVVPAGDRVALDLAARLVARAGEELARLLPGAPVDRLRAEPMPPDRFRAQLAAGAPPVLVFPLPARPLDPCGALADLRTRAPWLQAEAANVVVPLVETRAHLLLRGVPAVSLDADGGVRFVTGRVP